MFLHITGWATSREHIAGERSCAQDYDSFVWLYKSDQKMLEIMADSSHCF